MRINVYCVHYIFNPAHTGGRFSEDSLVSLEHGV